jgi:HPt (histidine-containing phosphotransfer) domain-containing protein
MDHVDSFLMTHSQGAHTYPSTLPVLDLDVFNELHLVLGGDSDRVRSVYAKFLDSAVQRLEELKHQPRDAGARTLHALKGSAGMVGASRLAACLEGALALSETPAAVIDDIERELTLFRGVLNGQLDETPGP